jgi:hypothetical protein
VRVDLWPLTGPPVLFRRRKLVQRETQDEDHEDDLDRMQVLDVLGCDGGSDLP